ncbi:MAG: hypothetical protein PVG81_13775, partial [Desulfobacterales bacterium]
LLDLTRFAGCFFRHDPSPCLVFIPIQGYSTQAYGVCSETLFYGYSGLLFLNAPVNQRRHNSNGFMES